MIGALAKMTGFSQGDSIIATMKAPESFKDERFWRAAEI